MKKYILILIVQFSFLACFSQSNPEDEENKKKMVTLVEDSQKGFAVSQLSTELLNDDKNIYYQSNISFGSNSEAIVLNKATKRKTYMCLIANKPGAMVNINDLQTLLRWLGSMEEIAKEKGYKYDRMKIETGLGGFSTTVTDLKGNIIIKVINNSEQKLLEVYSF